MGGEITVWEKTDEISLYVYHGMNILVGAIVQGRSFQWGQLSGGGNCPGGNCPKGVIS